MIEELVGICAFLLVIALIAGVTVVSLFVSVFITYKGLAWFAEFLENK